MLARNGKYNNCLFHRLVPGFMVYLYPKFPYIEIYLSLQ